MTSTPTTKRLWGDMFCLLDNGTGFTNGYIADIEGRNKNETIRQVQKIAQIPSYTGRLTLDNPAPIGIILANLDQREYFMVDKIESVLPAEIDNCTQTPLNRLIVNTGNRDTKVYIQEMYRRYFESVYGKYLTYKINTVTPTKPIQVFQQLKDNNLLIGLIMPYKISI